MPSQEDMRSWLKVLQNRLEEKRIKTLDKTVGKEIKYTEKNSYQVHIAFTDGSWIHLHIEWNEDDHSSHISTDETDYRLFWTRSFFFKAELISKPETDQIWDYYQALNKLECEEKDRKEYKRLKEKFEGK